jgi:hypothetical protein
MPTEISSRKELEPMEYRIRVTKLARQRYGVHTSVQFLPGVPVTVAIARCGQLLAAGQGVREAVRKADDRRAE